MSSPGGLPAALRVQPSTEELKESYTLYRTRVADVFLRRISAYLDHLMEEVWQQCTHANERAKHLKQFQNALCGVSTWSRAALERERDLLVGSSDVDDLRVTVACLLTLQVKLLSYVCPGQQKHEVAVDLPDECAFLHAIYLAAAAAAWRSAYLFHRGVDSLRQQHNRNELQRVLRETIHTTIDKFIPMKDIQRALLDQRQEEVVVVGASAPPHPTVEPPPPQEAAVATCPLPAPTPVPMMMLAPPPPPQPASLPPLLAPPPMWPVAPQQQQQQQQPPPPAFEENAWATALPPPPPSMSTAPEDSWASSSLPTFDDAAGALPPPPVFDFSSFT